MFFFFMSRPSSRSRSQNDIEVVAQVYYHSVRVVPAAGDQTGKFSVHSHNILPPISLQLLYSRCMSVDFRIMSAFLRKQYLGISM